jgi:hypothetical protein
MKTKLFLLLVLGALNAHAGFSKLEAISMIETGDNDRAVGKAGEISRYQLMPRTWRQYTSEKAYTNPAFATQIARLHLTSLEVSFRARAGREATDFDCYVLWNAGLSYYAKVGFNPNRVHHSIRERAERYVNLRQMNANGPMLAFSGVR